MNSVYIGNITLSIFGESHGKKIGVVIDGFPPGFEIDFNKINKEMDRRKPGKNFLNTSRKENDEIDIISGFFNGKTTGAPLCCLISSEDIKSDNYDKIKNKMRPGHSDYSGFEHYRGYNDYRGGGHFSGRLTAPIVFVGSLCKQFLYKKNINIGSHIKQLYIYKDRCFIEKDLTQKKFEKLSKEKLPLLDLKIKNPIKKAIIRTKKEGDSLGGILECAAIGIKAGIGSPFFHSLESQISHLIFSIPSIKGITFGIGSKFASIKGSESNDFFYIKNKKNIKTKTNNNGGILGGISNGMPIIFQCIIKSTPSISKEQETFDKKSLKNVILKIQGRHDPCIVPRIIPVIESMLAIAITDSLLEDLKWN